MAFSNIWDTTFPPDTQLANLLGLDLRNFRLDTQQRMAAISGLDASKPNFAGDAQPANWNGVLFFASDTGQIYQFNNPGWTNITSAILRTATIYKSSVPVNLTGTTSLTQIFQVTVTPVGINSRFRITLDFNQFASSGLTNTVEILFGSTIISSLSWTSLIVQAQYQMTGGNIGVSNSQRWDAHLVIGGSGSPQLVPLGFASSDGFGTVNPGGATSLTAVASAIDTTANVNVTVKAQPGANSDSLHFSGFIVEVL